MAGRKPKDEKRAEVERELYNYKSLLAGIENGPLNQFETDQELFEFERIIKFKINKTNKIKRGLSALTHKERELIELKYFDPRNPIDYEVYQELGIKNTWYYKLKEQALNKMANALNII
jgi:ArpU family phage transcriptional regulator